MTELSEWDHYTLDVRYCNARSGAPAGRVMVGVAIPRVETLV
jgi:hypothetical protein